MNGAFQVKPYHIFYHLLLLIRISWKYINVEEINQATNENALVARTDASLSPVPILPTSAGEASPIVESKDYDSTESQVC